MAGEIRDYPYLPVLIIESDRTHRQFLEQACRDAGVAVEAIGCFLELGPWPEGHLIITDAAHLTPIWRAVGAAEVVAVVRDAREGIAALHNGATRWIRRDWPPVAVATMVMFWSLQYRMTARSSGG